jgi:hypothetical protein
MPTLKIGHGLIADTAISTERPLTVIPAKAGGASQRRMPVIHLALG